MFDELLDSALDSKGCELVLSALKERVDKYNECIYLMSHKKEFTKNDIDNIIFLEKRNGITTEKKLI
jgi:ABC-type polar amino acid transport system ATPase subunit